MQAGAKKPHPGHSVGSFKANFNLSSTEWEEVAVPFTQFSIDWSEYTGDCDTKDPNGLQHYCCSDAHPDVCVKPDYLKAITGLQVWAEGKKGKFNIEIDYIGAGPLPSK